jgi:ABC-type Fe3+-hydroxamate transport system substrate-binding protein
VAHRGFNTLSGGEKQRVLIAQAIAQGAGHLILDEPTNHYLAGFHAVRDVSSDYFTLEELVGLHPDFLFASWNYGLQTGSNLTPQGLSKFGIKTLALAGPGLAMPTALIALGGGTNIFAGLKQSWTSVSWEQVVKADPGCVIINDYGTPTAAQKEKFLETSPITKNLTAVKNRCFLPLAYDEVTPSPRNAQAVVEIARWLHPAAFGLPADGS